MSGERKAIATVQREIDCASWASTRRTRKAGRYTVALRALGEAIDALGYARQKRIAVLRDAGAIVREYGEQ